jgi:hypothetical protein
LYTCETGFILRFCWEFIVNDDSVFLYAGMKKYIFQSSCFIFFSSLLLMMIVYFYIQA